jgi:hypothetical protein
LNFKEGPLQEGGGGGDLGSVKCQFR